MSITRDRINTDAAIIALLTKFKYIVDLVADGAAEVFDKGVFQNVAVRFARCTAHHCRPRCS